MDSRTDEGGLSRRGVLVTAAGVALGASGLAACGDGGGGSAGGYGAGPTGRGPTGRGSSGDGGTTAGADGSQATQGGGSRELVQLADVPVGGAVSAEDAEGDPVIVSRPTQREVVAFSAICTHRGCTVAPGDGILACPCHGSTYDIATGKNTGGPAPRPLARLHVSVVDGAVVEG